MRRQSGKDFSVFRFGDEGDDAVERAACASVTKFGNLTGNPRAYDEEETIDFLGAFGGRKHLMCSAGLFENRSVVSEHTSATDMQAFSGSEHIHTDSANVVHNCFSKDPTEMVKQNDGISDDSGGQSSSSSHQSSEDEENEGSLDAHNLVDWVVTANMNIDASVTVTPEFVMYQNQIYVESQLTFSVDSIKVLCLDAKRGETPLVFDWAISDLLFICCRWKIETAYIQVQLKQSDSCLSSQENGHDLSGIMCLTFTVCGSEWLSKRKKIWSLTPKYKDLWKTELDATVTSDNLSCNLDESIPFYPREQLTLFEETLGDVVYPQGDPDAVCISRRDIELLRPETFINDTIIDFYIKYLLDKIQLNTIRFHFFNSFFFRKLADLDKDPENVQGRAAFLRVRKWTRKVNIFEMDYIFIPVNFNFHWSLLVICHPGEIFNFIDEDVDKALRVPCILHLDSLRGSHNGLKGLIQSYLWEEWKERHNEYTEGVVLSNFLNLRFVQLELPQQENYFDCGLFLLHYVELFLKSAPVNFNPFKITSFSDFLTVDWFIPAEASFKRFHIRNLLYELLGNNNRNDSPQPYVKHSVLPDFANDVENVEVVQLPSQQDKLPASDLGHSVMDAGLELFDISSVNDGTCGDDQFKQQAVTSNDVEGVCNHHDFALEPIPSTCMLKGAMPTIMEEEDFDHSGTWQISYQILDGSADQACSTSSVSKEPAEAEGVGSPRCQSLVDQLLDSTTIFSSQAHISKEHLCKTVTSDDDDLSKSSDAFCNSCNEMSGVCKPYITAEDVMDCHFVGNQVMEHSTNEILHHDSLKVEQQNTFKIPETCIVDDSQDDDNSMDDIICQEEGKNVASSSVEYKVVPDSPNNLMLKFGGEKTPEPLASVHESGNNSHNAVLSASGASDGMVDSFLSHETTRSLHGTKDQVSPKRLFDDADSTISVQQQPKKRQKILHAGLERKKTRSFTSAQSL